MKYMGTVQGAFYSGQNAAKDIMKDHGQKNGKAKGKRK